MDQMAGRRLLEKELEEGVDRAGLVEMPGMKDGQCQRCGNRTNFSPIPCNCGPHCFYCTTCLNMGQVKSCSKLYYGPAKKAEPIAGPILTWQGTLSDQQAMASQAIVTSIDRKETRLLWAVTGAGKTEMLFEGIAYALGQGLRVGIASPRVDVCLELAPRIREAFQGVDLLTLYGGMEETYSYTPLVICTTHQLLRFYRAFDLLIIDEVDAFPFHGSRELYYGVGQAIKEEATLIYLTATPDKELRRKVQSKKLEATILPARYHGYKLPEPQARFVGNWRRDLLTKKSHQVFTKMQEWLRAELKFLVFLPQIDWMEAFDLHLRSLFPQASFTSVSSLDPQRSEKVLAMRAGAYDFLLTTTILERGVTFENIQVMVIGAEDDIFTEAALVQMAGRVGRKATYPKGEVIFYHWGQTRALKGAIGQIKKMNRLAKKRGLIHG